METTVEDSLPASISKHSQGDLLPPLISSTSAVVLLFDFHYEHSYSKTPGNKNILRTWKYANLQFEKEAGGHRATLWSFTHEIYE